MHTTAAAPDPTAVQPPTTLKPLREAVIDRLVARLDEQQLAAAATRIHSRRTEAAQKRLLELLRADSATLHRNGLTDSPARVIRITFTTSHEDYNPVCWDDNAIAWHSDGHRTRLQYMDTEVEPALRDYSGFTAPVDGSQLVVDLVSGHFSQHPR